MPRLQLAMPSSGWWRVLGWGSLTASALLLASLLQAVATASIDSAVQADPTTIDLSPGIGVFVTALEQSRDKPLPHVTRAPGNEHSSAFCRHAKLLPPRILRINYVRHRILDWRIPDDSLLGCQHRAGL